LRSGWSTAWDSDVFSGFRFVYEDFVKALVAINS